MKYEVQDKTHAIDFSGSALVGHFTMNRDELVARFGEPIPMNGAQMKERWFFEFEDGTKASIYSLHKDAENEWCIGGFGEYDKKTKENNSAHAIKQLLGL